MVTRIVTALALSVISVLLLAFPNISILAVKEAFQLCANAIIPSIFPFLVVSNLCFYLSQASDFDNKLCRRITGFFHLSTDAIIPILFGNISGFPTGAKLTTMMYQNNQLTKDESEHLLMFAGNAGPAFIFSVIGNRFFHSFRTTLLFWIIHLSSAIIVGLIFRSSDFASKRYSNRPIQQVRYVNCLVQAITTAGHTVIQICMFITLFSIITKFFEVLLPPLWKTGLCFPFLIGLVELSNGISQFPVAEISIIFPLLSALLAFNGMCIHLQVLSFSSETNLNMRKYFLGKTMQALIAAALSLLMTPFLCIEYSFQYYRTQKTICLLALSMLLCLICAIVKTSSGKKGTYSL